jgi:Calcineurin-like phosphoesterase
MSPVKKFWQWSLSRRNFVRALLAGTVLAATAKEAQAATLSVVAILKVLTDPTKATFTVKSNGSSKAYIEYGYEIGKYGFKSAAVSLKANVGQDVTLTKLSAGAKIFYRLRYAKSGSSTYLARPASTFTLPTAFNKSVFAVQADPHMDENSSADVYNGTLSQIVKSSPAFLVDLGDIFMVDKLADKSEKNIRARYELMKGYYAKLGSIPLKIVLGNHDGELGYSSFNTKKYRAEYFPEQTSELTYFSFKGPDQLHICLDPFTFTTASPKTDGWQWSLGKTQYDWLRSTLEQSTEKHKFVYIHHLLVGDAQSRGGVEIARRNEWGGANSDGTPGFEKNRPGWYKPVHELLVEHNVSFVFKGHDHLYVKQELDGIVYQTLPQPSHPGDKVDPTQYGYLSGKTVGGSGFLRVTTAGATAKVEFVKFDGSIADSYEKTVS